MKLIITAPRGKMAGLIVADAASRDDVEIIAGIGPKGRDYIGKDIGEVAMIGKTVGAPVVDDIESVIEDADVVCDFSTVELGMEVLDACLKHKKALVVGTTGFSPEQRARLEAAAAEIPIMIAANTDRMVNVMRKLLMDAARELYDDTDIEIIDMHDNTKLDAPSGTARELIESMGEAVGVDLVDDAVYGRPLGRHPREKAKSPSMQCAAAIPRRVTRSSFSAKAKDSRSPITASTGRAAQKALSTHADGWPASR